MSGQFVGFSQVKLAVPIATDLRDRGLHDAAKLVTDWAEMAEELQELRAREQTRTVRAKVSLVLNCDGYWAAYGWGKNNEFGADEDEMRRAAEKLMGSHTIDAAYVVEAVVPVPAPKRLQFVQGAVINGS